MKLSCNTTTNEVIKIEARVKFSGEIMSTFSISLTDGSSTSAEYEDYEPDANQWINIKVIFPPVNATHINLWYDDYMYISYLKITKYSLSE